MTNKAVAELVSKIADLQDEEAILEDLIKKEEDTNKKRKLKKDLGTCRMKLTKSEHKLNIYKAHFDDVM